MSGNIVLSAARMYGSFGWPIFPYSRYEREPKMLAQATCDPQKIEEWWSGSPPPSIGLALGELSGIVALGVIPNTDDRENVNGYAKLMEVVQRYGPVPNDNVLLHFSQGVHAAFDFLAKLPPGLSAPKSGELTVNHYCSVNSTGTMTLLPPCAYRENGYVKGVRWKSFNGKLLPLAPGWSRILNPKAYVKPNKSFNSRQSDLARRALANAEVLVRTWLPNGQFDGAEWVALNPHRIDRHLGSFRVNVTTGKWNDFSTGPSGMSLISLAAFVYQTDTTDAKRIVRDALKGLHHG